MERNGTEPVFGCVPLCPRDEEPPRGEEQRNETSRTNEEEEGGRQQQRQRREEEAEPVFERSGESGGYTFTDLHYPRFVPSSRPLAPWPPSDRLDTHPGAPPAHKLSRYTRARCTRHRRDPQMTSGASPPRSPLPSLSFSLHAVFYSKIMSRRFDREIPATRIRRRTKASLMKMFTRVHHGAYFDPRGLI